MLTVNVFFTTAAALVLSVVKVEAGCDVWEPDVCRDGVHERWQKCETCTSDHREGCPPGWEKYGSHLCFRGLKTGNWPKCRKRHCCPGWSGATCDDPICEGGCGEHGDCSYPNRCTCKPGWKGAKCDLEDPLSADSIKALVVCAVYGEFQAVKTIFNDVDFKQSATQAGQMFHYAEVSAASGSALDGRPTKITLILVKGFIGGLNIHGLVSDMLEMFTPRYLIMAGRCAGRRSKVSVGDVIVARHVFSSQWRDDGTAQDEYTYTADDVLEERFQATNAEIDQWKTHVTVDRPNYDQLADAARYILYNMSKVDENSDGLDARNLRAEIGKFIKTDKDVDLLALQPFLNSAGVFFYDDSSSYKLHQDERKRLNKVERMAGDDKALRPTVKQPKAVMGTIVSADRVRKDMNEAEWKKLDIRARTFGLEMEGVSIFRAGYEYNTNKAHLANAAQVRIVLVKGAGDYGEEDKEQWKAYSQFAEQMSAAWIRHFIENYAVISVRWQGESSPLHNEF